MCDGLAQNRAPVVDLGHIPSLYIHRHHASNPIVFFSLPNLIPFHLSDYSTKWHFPSTVARRGRATLGKWLRLWLFRRL